MRGKKAKVIRKLIYGNIDIRIKEYKEGHDPQMMKATGEKDPVTLNMFYRPNPTVICVGLRRKYQNLKAIVQTIGKKPTVYEAYESLN